MDGLGTNIWFWLCPTHERSCEVIHIFYVHNFYSSLPINVHWSFLNHFVICLTIFLSIMIDVAVTTKCSELSWRHAPSNVLMLDIEYYGSSWLATSAIIYILPRAWCLDMCVWMNLLPMCNLYHCVVVPRRGSLHWLLLEISPPFISM
jgi:hypothetical protein